MTESVKPFPKALALRDFEVLLEGRPIVKGIDLDVGYGEIVALTGPNGAGKSSLLRALVGELPWQGRLDKPASLGYVPQRLAFDPASCATVLDFFALGLSSWPLWLGVLPKVREQARVSLERVGALSLLDQRFGTPSGGERQRVLLALALVPRPDLLLLDEPETGIDLDGIELFHHAVGRICEHCRIGVLVVTHSPETVARIATRQVRMEDGRLLGSAVLP